MNIGTISNGESGLSVRTKLNTVISAVNQTVPDVFTIHFTGSLPPGFPPVIEIDATGGQVDLMGSSGDIPVNPFTGIVTQTNFVFTDQLNVLTSLTFDNLAAITGSSGIAISASSALVSLYFPALAYVGGNFSPTSLSALTTLSIPTLAFTGGDFAPSGLSITTLSCPLLAYVKGSFNPSFLSSCTTLNCPLLETVGADFSPAVFGSITTISLPVLKSVVNNFTLTGFALTTLSIPALQFVGNQFTFRSSTLATLSLPALAYVLGGVFTVSNSPNLTTVSLPALVSINAPISFQTGNGLISSFTLGTVGLTKNLSGTSINISGQALTAASVNGILALLVSLDGTGGTTLWGTGKTVNISGGTSAAPSGQGIIDKATLVGRGATVTTN